MHLFAPSDMLPQAAAKARESALIAERSHEMHSAAQKELEASRLAELESRLEQSALKVRDHLGIIQATPCLRPP